MDASAPGIDSERAIPVPQPRPARAWLDELGTSIEQAEHHIAANAMSAHGDVGGQCCDGQPRARHARPKMPPDRGEFEDHAAPQP